MIETSRAAAQAASTPQWHAEFLSMLPAIERCARRAFEDLGVEERQEAIQAVVAYAATAYAGLFQAGRADIGRATPLARFGVKQYRAGRLVGGAVNSRDVGSASCRLRGCHLEPLEDWKEALCETRRATPADIAALRIDFNEWFRTLSSRDQRVASALARGEQTSSVAQMFKLTAGRVSQLRNQLYQSWQQFTGEPVPAPS
jgi:hypothetical protein